MPRFGKHAALLFLIRAEETEAVQVFIQPLVQRTENAAFARFFGQQLRTVAQRHGGGIHHVDFRAPMVTAAAR